MSRNLQQLGALLKGERERAGSRCGSWPMRPAGGIDRFTAGNRLHCDAEARPFAKAGSGARYRLEGLSAAAGYLTEGALPELKPYLRAKYGLTDELAGRMESDLQALRDTNQLPGGTT